MVKTNTILGKAAVVAMLPALTLGIFAVPSAASADNGAGVTTEVGVMNVNAGMSKTVVVSGANSGGNTIMAGSMSTGGDSGDSTGVNASARAEAANSADVADVEAEGDEGSKYERGSRGDDSESEAEADAIAAGNAKADAVASSKTGDGGAAGKATTVSTIMTGDAKSDVAVLGGTDKNEVDIDITDDCDCDRANTYHEESMRFLDLSMASEYDQYYKAVEEESETESEKGRGGDNESEWEYEEEVASESGSESLDMTAGESWSVSKKEYVPVHTRIMVGNANMSYEETTVLSGANSGMNAIIAGSVSMGGDSGNSAEVAAEARADARNSATVEDVEAEGGDEAEAEAYAGAHGNAKGAAGAASETGNGGASADSTTDSLILSGRSDSIVTVVETSRHNVVRIRR